MHFGNTDSVPTVFGGGSNFSITTSFDFLQAVKVVDIDDFRLSRFIISVIFIIIYLQCHIHRRETILIFLDCVQWLENLIRKR